MRRLLALFLIALMLTGCAGQGGKRPVRLATTTSPYDSGLLPAILPAFEKASGYKVEVLALGTGQALATAARGDADVVMVHARTLEEKFIADGHGLRRLPVMMNDFVIAGPAADPAGVGGQAAAEALRRIAAGAHTWVSRADESGTHQKEKELWLSAGVTPGDDWYIRAGAGMAETLRIASEKGAYVLVDRGTFLAQKGKLQLTILVEKNPPLENHYSIIAVNPQRHRHVNTAGAEALIRWITGPDGQRRIGEFGRETFGEPLFTPTAR